MHWLVLTVPLFGLMACEEAVEGTDPATGELGPVYAMVIRVDTAEDSFNYLHLLENLDDQTLDTESGVELPGSGNAFTANGDLYITNDETLSITRYTVDAERTPIQQETVSFQNLGTQWFGWRPFVFVDDTRALFFDASSSQVITWNPTTMELGDTVAVQGLERGKLFPEFGIPRQTDDAVLMSVNWSDWYDINETIMSAGVVRFPLDDLSAYTVDEDTRCGGAWQTGLADDGTMYFGGDQYWSWYRYYGPKQSESCVLRVNPGESEFDTSFEDDLSAYTDGEPLHTMTLLGDTFYATTVVEDQTVFDEKDPDTWWSGRYLHMWTGDINDLSTAAYQPDFEFEPGQILYPEYSVDGVDYVTQDAWPSAGSVAIRPILEDGSFGDGIKASGTLFNQLLRVR
ncbi:MAG: hypothetical protein AAGA48_09375 [Myxococcota bacterium]